MDSKTIKHVATYLRKSRDGNYRQYEGVASGEKIEARKDMLRLLRHVEDKLYDGVAVMDINRFGDSNYHQNKIYDLEVDNDDVSFKFMSIAWSSGDCP